MEHGDLIEVLAYTPFIDPINAFHGWWYLLLVPLCFGISVIYRALKLPTLEHYWRAVLTMTAQIILVMIGLAIALVVVVTQIIPRLPPE